ncbi:hypothetical protein EFB14_00315 [Rhizobium fabae]|uniref:Uncharacterized protein n=1 Tax=Rhizobium fabae TaxID=573179 RepID=A0ABY0BGU1_9HYPH|nr:hypothetical protein EFB14_00315 [Rhizobium fabae]
MQEVMLARVLRGSGLRPTHLRMRSVGGCRAQVRSVGGCCADAHESLILRCPAGASKGEAGARPC